tara:strand:- start:3157 stop:3807 length:651 start_codon:yes stop_codon:yes gene_type:complete
MLKKKEIESLIIDAEKEYGFKQGYKLLYVPWETIYKAKIAFISVNPGNPPDNADLRVLSDENGNSYQVEEDVTKSPLTRQFLKLSKFLGVAPIDILTGAFCPFRSNKWKDFSTIQKKIGCEIGKHFWFQVLRESPIKLIITLGHGEELLRTITNPIVKEFNAKLEDKIFVWKGCFMSHYSTKDLKIIQLPHLSQHQIFDKNEVYMPSINQIFKDVL